jgi:hypothetical protein
LRKATTAVAAKVIATKQVPTNESSPSSRRTISGTSIAPIKPSAATICADQASETATPTAAIAAARTRAPSWGTNS